MAVKEPTEDDIKFAIEEVTRAAQQGEACRFRLAAAEMDLAKKREDLRRMVLLFREQGVAVLSVSSTVQATHPPT